MRNVIETRNTPDNLVGGARRVPMLGLAGWNLFWVAFVNIIEGD